MRPRPLESSEKLGFFEVIMVWKRVVHLSHPLHYEKRMRGDERKLSKLGREGHR